jgi:hypothetical protein
MMIFSNVDVQSALCNAKTCKLQATFNQSLGDGSDEFCSKSFEIFIFIVELIV